MTTLSVEKQRYPIESESELRLRLRNEGFAVFSWQDPPGSSYSSHSHPNDEFIVVYAGEICFVAEGTRLQLQPGDLLNLPANTVHEAINDGTCAAKYFICTRY